MSHITTKEELKKIIELWPTHSIAQIATAIGTKKGYVQAMTYRIRKGGIVLPKKSKAGYLLNLIEEIKNETKQ